LAISSSIGWRIWNSRPTSCAMSTPPGVEVLK
jgi:hypothetical protein